MKKLLLTSAVAFLSVSTAAHATVVNVVLGNTGSDIGYNTGVALTPNVDLSTLGSSLTLVNASIISPPSSTLNLFTSDTGPLFGNSYLQVSGIPTTGSATFTLPPQNVFGFTWGTIDTYNSVTVTDARNVSYSITGAQILAQIAGSVAGTTQSDVSFTDAVSKIVTVQLTSSNNAFEVANFGDTTGSVATPIPPALPLFGAALLLGYAVFYRRQNNDKNNDRNNAMIA